MLRDNNCYLVTITPNKPTLKMSQTANAVARYLITMGTNTTGHNGTMGSYTRGHNGTMGSYTRSYKFPLAYIVIACRV